MTLPREYIIKPISRKEAMKIVIENHYLHRASPCNHAFGLYKINAKKDELFSADLVCGVVIYGVPPSRSLQIGICGKEEADNVLELNRLWVSDDVERNGESYLIGNSIKRVDKEIIVSYADASVGHIGYVYQATNWIYTGLSDAHVQWVIKDNPENHSRHRFDKYGGVKKAKKILGDKMIRTERPRKHRYIYFNCDKRRKRELIKKLRYKIFDYPKKNNGGKQ